MDIDLLSKMVKELILDNDEVTLPGVGTFVAEIVPSTFSDKGYTINPPYRKLSFRQRQSNDTLLKDFYMASNNLPRESAQKILEDFFDEMDEVLRQKKVIIFPGLGRLRATKENNFFFVADEDLNIYPEGYGLEPISLKTHQETKEEVGAALDSLKDILSPAAAVPSNVAHVIEQPATAPVPVEVSVVDAVNPEVADPEVVESEVVESEVTDNVTETAVESAPEIEPIVEVVAPDSALSPSLEPEEQNDVVSESETIVTEPTEIEEPEVSTENDEIETVVEPEPISKEEVSIDAQETVDATNETSTPEQPVEVAPVAEIKSDATSVEESKTKKEETVSPAVEVDAKKKKSPVKIALTVILIVLLVAAIALLLFIFLAHIAPVFIDSLLYTEEELRIINY